MTDALDEKAKVILNSWPENIIRNSDIAGNLITMQVINILLHLFLLVILLDLHQGKQVGLIF